MIYGLIIIILSYLISSNLINHVVQHETSKDRYFLKQLFFYHLMLSAVFYLYAIYNPSDSHHYYAKVLLDFRGPEWKDFYGTSTTFIEWFGYPFIRYMGFTYEAMMALFSFLGFLGFLFFYQFFKERIFFKQKFLGLNLLTLFFLLPNLHFWSASYDKGSFIFLGIGMFFYGLNNIPKRWLIVIVGGLITYHIRPHVMLVMLVSTAIGFSFSSKGTGWGIKIAVIAASIGAFFFIYKDVLSLVGIEQGEKLIDGLALSERASDLTRATSGVDITSYSIPEQLFAFLYRPLFFDSPGILGVIVSFENVFLLLITIFFVYKGGLMYLIKGDFLVKTAFLSFITVSIALAQISGNLGLAIRQKSQVMMLFLFVIIKFLDDQKLKNYRKKWMLWQRKKRMRIRQQVIGSSD